MYTEGCPERLRWLSDAPITCPSGKQRAAAEATSHCDYKDQLPITFAEATQHLLAALLTLRLPGAAAFDHRQINSGAAAAAAAAAGSRLQAPQSTEDMLWWCSQGKEGAGFLDDLMGCLHGLLSLAAQGREVGMVVEAAALVDVLRKVRSLIEEQELCCAGVGGVDG